MRSFGGILRNSSLSPGTQGRGRTPPRPLEVAFTAIDGGARVELTHSGWEKLGEKALETRNGYDSGWDIVFGERYAGWTEQEAASR